MRRLIMGLVAGLVAVTLWPAVGQAGIQGPEWERLIGGASFDGGADIARAQDGSLLVVGTLSGDRFGGVRKPGGHDIVLLKLTPMGAVEWFRFLGGTKDESGTDVAIASNGAVYVLGYGNSSKIGGIPTAGKADIILARYSLTGALDWVQTYGTERDDRGQSIAVTDAAVFVAGEMGSDRAEPSSDYDFFVAKLRRDGTEEWRSLHGGGGAESAQGVAVDPNGAVYATGWSSGPTFDGRAIKGDSDLLLLRLKPDGTTDWLRRYGGDMIDRGEGVTALPDGSAVVTGQLDMIICCGNPSGFGRLVVQRYSPTGKLAWSKYERHEGFNYGVDVSLSPEGWVQVLGATGGVAFQGGDAKIVYLRYQQDGYKQLRREFGGAGFDTPGGLVSDETSVYIVGTVGKEGLPGQPSHGESDIAVFRTPNGPLRQHVRTHPAGTRTGVKAVDDVLDLVEANDVQGIVDAVDWEMVPCDDNPGPGIILPPRCPGDEPDGTLVEVVKVACGTWRYVRPGALGAYVRMALNNDRGTFGVEKTRVPDNLGILPPNGHGILLAVRENLHPPGFGPYEYAKDAADADGFLVGIGEDGITGFWFGCGMPPATMFWKEASWLLEPVGHQGP